MARTPQPLIRSSRTSSTELALFFTGAISVNHMLNVPAQALESTSMYRSEALTVTGVDTDYLAMLLTAYRELADELDKLKKDLAQVKEAVAPVSPEVREISDATAKAEIRAFFKERQGETIYPDDVAEALNIDLMQAIRVCEALSKEGKIARTTGGSS